MIWYLLYPLRGTTEAPVLAPSHPLRHALARYGTHAARHVVTTLLVSVAVATILLYPIPFLFTTDFTNAASNLPHHAWTGARPLSHSANVEPDVIMRSIWVHSNYMGALDKSVLSSALELQDALLGLTQDFDPRQFNQDGVPQLSQGVDLSPEQRNSFHAINGLTNQSWFFHSPLLYWGCSHDRINADTDIIATVNDKKGQQTPANVTLRHSIVFSGKRFEDRRLLAADALVITLIHLRDSPVGQQWERNAKLLTENVVDKWDIYVPSGQKLNSQLYEFQFRPISKQDAAILALAYTLTVLYFLMSLSKLRAVKSKFGLIVTIMAQIFFAVMSSFTICAVFRIDLSRIPSTAYPLVVLAMSLENIFRLINAVILTPSEDATSSRIGYAFGETAYTALASSTQNVLLLVGLSRLVSPGVSAFCIFAAIAIIFDFFYLSTFFLSVLSVDVRRTELSDALAKASMRHNRRTPDLRPQTSWIDSVLQGKIAISTRIAGTIVMLGFVLVAQWHFSEDAAISKFFGRLYQGSQDADRSVLTKRSTLEDIHQARSPTSWLRLQDHETASEIISIIKPSAYSYIAKVYEPLVFVSKNANRQPGRKEPTFLPAAYDFVNHQFTRFVIIVFVVIAAVRLLTSYLLWEDEANDDNEPHMDEDRFSIKSFSGGHALDVAMLTASSKGHIVSVGLDRSICIWDLRSGSGSYAITDYDHSQEVLFPVLAMAMSEDSKWLAILSSSSIAIWSLVRRSWGPSMAVDLCGQKPEAFFFFNDDASAEDLVPRLALVRRNGTMAELAPSIGETQEFGVCRSPLTCVRPMIQKSDTSQLVTRVSIVTSSRRGCVHTATRDQSSWTSVGLQMAALEDHDVHQVVPLPCLGMFLAAGSTHVHLISLITRELVHTFKTEPMQQRSLQSSSIGSQSSQATPCGVKSFTLCYTAAESGDCVLQTYVPQEDGDLICLDGSVQSTRTGWCSWDTAKTTNTHVPNPGKWNVLADGSIVGVRQRPRLGNGVGAEGRPGGDGLRHRSPRKEHVRNMFGRWELWTVSHGHRARPDETRPLFEEAENYGHLFVSELGPLVDVGQRSIAFGFGNVVKVITVGSRERFETNWDRKGPDHLANVGSRRRKTPSSLRPTA